MAELKVTASTLGDDNDDGGVLSDSAGSLTRGGGLRTSSNVMLRGSPLHACSPLQQQPPLGHAHGGGDGPHDGLNNLLSSSLSPPQRKKGPFFVREKGKKDARKCPSLLHSILQNHAELMASCILSVIFEHKFTFGLLYPGRSYACPTLGANLWQA